jgi:hypothetical protein
LLAGVGFPARLEIGPPGDSCEREADAIADRAMGLPDSALQRWGRGSAPAATAPAVVRQVLASAGEPLDLRARAFLEPRLGADLGHIRIHRDATADSSARAVHALAYAVARHVVFAEGRYRPDTPAGLRLLAHEAVHTLQQAAGRPPVLRRVPAPETTADCAAVPATRWIRRIEVNQETPQRVTWEWNDGAREDARCSTGKGHCCIGPEAVQAAASTERGSRQGGSNLTPVGRRAVASRTRVTAGGVEFWTEFHSGRSIALHEYAPVDGTPLSHGCVRMDHGPAVRIWCGSRPGRTTVHVTGLARPRCDHPALRREWLSDFRESVARPGDGEPPFDARRRRHIALTRRELRSALGVSDPELTRRMEALRGRTHDFALPPSASDRAAAAAEIPRCLPIETTEERRLGAPGAAPAPGTPRAFIAAAGFDARLGPLERDFRRSTDAASARRAVGRHGRALWEAATRRARGASADTDDRPLYWTRLAMAQIIRDTTPPWLDRLDPDTHRRIRASLLDQFERSSRGMESAALGDPGRVKRVVISGFDPFGLGAEVRRSNPSGAAVLALDGRLLTAGAVSGRIEGAIFPVRFPDFDAGVVERFFGRFLTGPRRADLIMTISMGGSGATELEEWAGRRRSSSAPGNLGLSGGGTVSAPVVPPRMGPGGEFLETTVPPAMLASMRRALGRTGALAGEREVLGRPPGGGAARRVSGAAALAAGLTAIEGAGGGYLSNEIYYRVLRAVRERDGPIPMIHLHTPLLHVTGPGAGDAALTAARERIVTDVERVLRAALPTL